MAAATPPQVSFRGSAVPVGNPNGHWGPITSAIDWCELNYVYTRYIAEVWNASSSLCMVAAGAVGISLHRSTLEHRFLWAFFFVAVLGAGSVAFHGSLKHETQMLDELPMLYAAFCTTYVLVENERTPRWRWLGPALCCWAVVTSLATALAQGAWQFALFHASFGSAEFFSLYRVWQIYRRHASSSENMDAASIRARKDISLLFRRGMASYALGLFCWQFDLRNCWLLQVWWPSVSGMPNPQLHAWWHVFVSCGFYMLITLTAYDRLIVLGERPVLRWQWRCVPYVEGTKHE